MDGHFVPNLSVGPPVVKAIAGSIHGRRAKGDKAVKDCTGCHDSTTATQHMESNGGSFYRDRTTSLAKSEQCMFCHQPTSAFNLGIKSVHTIK